MADKGEYRGIYVALLDSWEFQELTACARSCLIALKIKLGKAGIDVFYPESLPRYTGFSADECAAGLAELVEGRWLRVERNVYWLRNGLRFEPSEPLSNSNGRKGIVNHLRTLPAVAIIGEFVAYYGLEAEASEPLRTPTPSKAPRKGLTNPLRTTETEDGDGRRKTETDLPAPPSGRGAPKGAKPKVSRSPKAGKRMVPKDFQPKDSHREKAAALDLDVDEEAEAFVQHHRAKGTTFADVDLGFFTWLRNAKRFQRTGYGGNGAAPASAAGVDPDAPWLDGLARMSR